MFYSPIQTYMAGLHRLGTNSKPRIVSKAEYSYFLYVLNKTHALSDRKIICAPVKAEF